jgi:DNA-binding NarL/FixJ family response regulator
VRAGLRRILEPQDGITIVGECEDGDEVVAAVERSAPDVVVIDVRMRRVDGAEATRRLAARDDPPPVLVLTTFDDDETATAALGARGEDIVRAATTVAGGGAWLDPQVTGRVLGAYRRTAAAAAQSPGGGDAGTRLRLAQLTSREHDVLRLVAHGRTNAEIAAAPFISEATVKSHIGHILTKLALRDRAAVRAARWRRGR